MSLTLKLFLAQARQQKIRLTLTAMAMIAAIAVVLWVVSAYEMVASKFDDQTAEFVGKYTAFVVPRNLDEQIPADVVEALSNEPLVEAANPVAQFRMWFHRVGKPSESDTPQGQGRRRRRGMGVMGPTVVGTNAVEPRYPLVDGRWLNPEESTETVVSSGVADALSLKPGDAIEFDTKSGEKIRQKVVGITEQVDDVEFAMTRTKGGAPGGTNRGPASLAAYVPLSAVESLTGSSAMRNLVEIRLNASATIEKLESQLAATFPTTEILSADDVRSKLAAGFVAEGARKQAYFVTALSIIASAFIIFTTLSMGVNERSRQLAVLRAVGLRRTQIASLVLVEALVLAVLGWLGGLAAGLALLKILASSNPRMFPDGVALGGMSVVLSAACSLAGSLLASIFPIWKATRISPLEAMAPLQPKSRGSHWYVTAGLISFGLIALNPILVYLPDLPESVRFFLVMCVGAPASILGFIMLAPMIVLMVERIFSPLVAKALRLQTTLVQTQLSANMWRSTGIAASLMLGLGLYTATQTWGWSMLGGFLPGQWTPDTIVMFKPGLPDDAIEKVRLATGASDKAFLPIAVEQAKLVGDPLRSHRLDSAVRQDNVALIGVDVQQAFGGSSPPFQLTFVQGDREQALEKLQKGRFCLVPESFLQVAGLGVGDSIGLTPPETPGRSVEYTIAGVVAMPGSNWMTKTTGIRRRSVRTAGIVFAPRANVREDFNLPSVEYFWLDPKSGVTTEELTDRLRPLAASVSQGTLKAVKERAKGPTGGYRRPGGGDADSIQVTSLSEVRNNLQRRGGAAVAALGWLPLITLIVVSLGIVNTIAASVRARQWEFGILRAIGLRRFGLTRLVLSEALLIGIVASILSLAFGVLTGWTCLGLVRYVSNPWFEGVATPLVIPWSKLVFGYGLTFLLCVIAAIWPAVSSGRAEPLKLLQGGRAAT